MIKKEQTLNNKIVKAEEKANKDFDLLESARKELDQTKTKEVEK